MLRDVDQIIDRITDGPRQADETFREPYRARCDTFVGIYADLGPSGWAAAQST